MIGQFQKVIQIISNNTAKFHIAIDLGENPTVENGLPSQRANNVESVMTSSWKFRPYAHNRYRAYMYIFTFYFSRYAH